MCPRLVISLCVGVLSVPGLRVHPFGRIASTHTYSPHRFVALASCLSARIDEVEPRMISD
jgi:hypothetical protein